MSNILLLIMILLIILITIGLFTWFYIHQHKKFKKAAAIIITSSLLIGGGLFLLPPGDIIPPSTGTIGNYLWFGASGLNAFFRTNTTQHFNKIYLDDSYTRFNDTLFIIDSTNRINVTIMYMNPDISSASNGDEVLDFYANTTSGLVTFTIGGFKNSYDYQIKRNNIVVNNTKSNATGYAVFKNSIWSEQHFEIFDNIENGYNATIRTYGIDHFTWLGTNTTAYYVYKNITGLDETSEYIAVWRASGKNNVWVKYYGDKSGTNWSIKTYDVVRSYMNDAVGNITFGMIANPNINYDASRTVILKKMGNGYNYTGYTKSSATTLSAINTTLTLPKGYFIGLWNRTTFTWNYWISGFGITDKSIIQYNVIMSKINADKTWVM